MNEYIQWLSDLRQWLIMHQPVFVYVCYAILSIHLFQNAVYMVQLPLAAFSLLMMRIRRPSLHSWWRTTSDVAQPISILVTLYERHPTLLNDLRAMLSLRYPVYEVVVISDDTTGAVLQQLISSFALVPSARAYEYQVRSAPIRTVYRSEVYHNLIVVDKEGSGHKADALNAGLNVARYPSFCSVEASTTLQPDALLDAVQPFINDPSRTVAVRSTVRVRNGCTLTHGLVTQARPPTRWIALFQVIEYLRVFLMARLAWRQISPTAATPGMCAVFNRVVAIEAGGFSTRRLGQDDDLIFRMIRYLRACGSPYRIAFAPKPVCWIEVPESLRHLRAQRIHWQQNGLHVLADNSRMIGNPRYGVVGMVTLPLTFMLNVVAPLAEIGGYVLIPLLYWIGLIDQALWLAFIAVFFLMGITSSIMSLALEELFLKQFDTARSVAKLALVAILENFGYRQLNSFWQLIGCVRHLNNRWHDKRLGV